MGGRFRILCKFLFHSVKIALESLVVFHHSTKICIKSEIMTNEYDITTNEYDILNALNLVSEACVYQFSVDLIRTANVASIPIP